MELRGYSRYHLGIKIKSNLALDEFKPLFKEIASEKGYILTGDENKNTGINDIISEGLNFGIEKIGEKDGISINFNLSLRAISFVGKNPEEVSKIFKESLEFLESKDYDLPAVIDFFEVFAQVYFVSDKSPEEILEEKSKLDLSKISQMGEGSINSIKIKSKSSITNSSDPLEITLEPNPLRPSKEFLVTILKQNKDRDSISDFYTLIEESIKSLIE